MVRGTTHSMMPNPPEGSAKGQLGRRGQIVHDQPKALAKLTNKRRTQTNTRPSHDSLSDQSGCRRRRLQPSHHSPPTPPPPTPASHRRTRQTAAPAATRECLEAAARAVNCECPLPPLHTQPPTAAAATDGRSNPILPPLRLRLPIPQLQLPPPSQPTPGPVIMYRPQPPRPLPSAPVPAAGPPPHHLSPKMRPPPRPRGGGRPGRHHRPRRHPDQPPRRGHRQQRARHQQRYQMTGLRQRGREKDPGRGGEGGGWRRRLMPPPPPTGVHRRRHTDRRPAGTLSAGVEDCYEAWRGGVERMQGKRAQKTVGVGTRKEV